MGLAFTYEKSLPALISEEGRLVATALPEV